MDNLKNANELKPGEKVRLVSSNSKLAQLTNKDFIIIKPDNNSSNPRYVHLKVNNNFQPTTTSGNANGTLTEGPVTIKQKRIRVTPPESVFKGLIKKTRTPAKIGDVDDIIIYAYKQFEGKNSASVKRKLMVNDDEVNEKIPPVKSAINDYRKNPSYSKDFKLEQNNTIICYISIARYTYNGTVWDREWLQTNQLGQAIWARAVPKESN